MQVGLWRGLVSRGWVCGLGQPEQVQTARGPSEATPEDWETRGAFQGVTDSPHDGRPTLKTATTGAWSASEQSRGVPSVRCCPGDVGPAFSGEALAAEPGARRPHGTLRGSDSCSACSRPPSGPAASEAPNAQRGAVQGVGTLGSEGAASAEMNTRVPVRASWLVGTRPSLRNCFSRNAVFGKAEDCVD